MIQIVKEKTSIVYLKFKDILLLKLNRILPSIPIYRLTLNKQFDSVLDVKYWIEEMSGSLHALSQVPSELTDYIKI